MSGKKLGRGLDALIRASAPEEPAAEESPGDRKIHQIDPRRITVNRAQPRHHFDETALKELAHSIQVNGILQPLVVRRQEDGSYELVAGERRLRASQLAGLTEVPAVVQEIDTERLLEVALIENIQREDLNPIELALAYKELKERHEFTQAQLAERLGKNRASIANVLRYLDLEQDIQNSLATGQISPGHAKVLLSVSRADERLRLNREIREESLSVRALEERIAAATRPSPPPRPGKERPPRPPEIADQEDRLSRALGTKVQIQANGKRGKIILEFYSLDDFERLERRLTSSDPAGS